MPLRSEGLRKLLLYRSASVTERLTKPVSLLIETLRLVSPRRNSLLLESLKSSSLSL
jgi:hypothetical protein